MRDFSEENEAHNEPACREIATLFRSNIDEAIGRVVVGMDKDKQEGELGNVRYWAAMADLLERRGRMTGEIPLPTVEGAIGNLRDWESGMRLVVKNGGSERTVGACIERIGLVERAIGELEKRAN